ncbi:unnamed protein product [Caenorhabditis nigoni]
MFHIQIGPKCIDLISGPVWNCSAKNVEFCVLLSKEVSDIFGDKVGINIRKVDIAYEIIQGGEAFNGDGLR